MEENKNNDIQMDSLEQVAGGGPGTIRDLENQLSELNRILKNEYAARNSALKRLDTSPGADVTVKIAEENILDLRRLIHQKEKELADLREEINDIL